MLRLGSTAALDALFARVRAGTIPALHLGATTASGPLYCRCEGERILGTPEQGEVGEDTLLRLYSCTKLVTAVAVLQLVDRGVWSLDDPAVVSQHCPEIAALDVITGTDAAGTPTWTPRRTPLTLRHLCAHTSGLGYPLVHPLSRAYKEAHRLGSFWSGDLRAFVTPPTFEPGSHWRYGMGLDWAGIAVERATGLPLEDYFAKHIFAPLGITDMTFRPDADAGARLQAMCKRDGKGKLKLGGGRSDALLGPAGPQVAGGAGLYGSARSWLRFLQGLLASASPAGTQGGEHLLSPAGFRELFTNSLPPPGQDGNLCTEDVRDMGAEQVTNHSKERDVGRIEHSVAFPLTTRDSIHGRRAGSGQWGGWGQSLYWIDPTTKLAGMCFTSLDCRNPDPYFETYNDFERALYDALEEGGEA